jgi:hypothetical protein
MKVIGVSNIKSSAAYQKAISERVSHRSDRCRENLDTELRNHLLAAGWTINWLTDEMRAPKSE